MASFLDIPLRLLLAVHKGANELPTAQLFALIFTIIFTTSVFIYAALFVLAPTPRLPFDSEKKYITTRPNGLRNDSTSPRALPCWHDDWAAHRHKAEQDGDFSDKDTGAIEDAVLEMSVVIPAYNEEERMEIMLEEAVAFLDAEYGRVPMAAVKAEGKSDGSWMEDARGMGGYEILIVNDGSKDNTVSVALEFSRKHQLHDILRICTLKENRGKGGAVTHGFRHVRGAYAVFADADGASKFEDLAKLVAGCKDVADKSGRAIAVGSRSHMVGSEAVIKRSALRNALMHSFHLLLRLLTPPATSRIRDTQCGFKLFSRASLPHIIPYMHAEGWIFDVEMLMLAESAPDGIRVAEVQIGWKEVGGSKLNVMWDSLGMAYGLALLRACWMAGVYRRR